MNTNNTANQELNLHCDMDAKRWAREFVETWREVVPSQPPPDEDWMHTWFATAIMCGYDEALRRARNLPPDFDSTALAAQCWCFPETASIEMDTRLAERFAKTIEYVKSRQATPHPTDREAIKRSIKGLKHIVKSGHCLSSLQSCCCLREVEAAITALEKVLGEGKEV